MVYQSPAQTYFYQKDIIDSSTNDLISDARIAMKFQPRWFMSQAQNHIKSPNIRWWNQSFLPFSEHHPQ